MVQISIVSGIYSTKGADYRQSYPVNYCPAVLETGLSNSYLRQTPGVKPFVDVMGINRGVIEFNGLDYRVSGSSLVRLYSNGVAEELGVIPGTDQVSMAKSIDRICIVADGRGFYWTESAGLVEVSDPNFGRAIDVIFVDGYFLFIDEQFIFNSSISDPTVISPTSYGSAEVEGDPNRCVWKIGNEPYVCGAETIEVFQNVGGSGFPFQRINGAVITKGVVGTHAALEVEDALFFVGAGRGEAPSVYMGSAGQAVRIATDEVEKLIQANTPQELALISCESYTLNGQYFVMIHLKDQTLVYDLWGSKAAGVPLWHFRKSDGGQYRLRGFSRVFGKWIVGDSKVGRVGEIGDDVATEYGETVLREFTTPMGFADGKSFLVHSIELFGLPGRTSTGTNPQVFMSFTRNGMTWSDERMAASGRKGMYDYVPAWRRIGRAYSQMALKFRVANDSFFTPARVEVTTEVLGA